MGHIRLGQLPKTKQWSQVIDLLDDPDVDAPTVARAIVTAAEQAYRLAGDDPGVVESLRVMAFLAAASRRDDFANALVEFGLPAVGGTSALGFLAHVFDETERRFGPTADRTIFSEFALAALQESVSQTVGQQTGTLFLSGVDEIRDAYRSFSTERGFAKLARLFFARFMARSLRYFSDQEVTKHLGGDGLLREQADIRAFNEAVDRYSFEAARIVEDFAGGWYSKRLWLGHVEQTEGLAAVAMRKIADELALAT
jgi:hypothetical protein